MFFYYQISGGEERWSAMPQALKEKTVAEHHPMYVTALSVSKLVEDLSHEEKLKLAYEGPLYFDWDAKDGELVISKVNQFLDALVEMRVDLSMCRLYATGKKGYHLEIPQQLFIEKLPKGGIAHLPSIYREMALKLAVDTLDLTVYSAGRGRMWRQPNVLRDNGRYKVAITVAEMRAMTEEQCLELTSAPRDPVPVTPPELNAGLMMLYAKAAQDVEELMKRRAKFKADPKARDKANGASIEMFMAGFGVKDGLHFHQIALQLSVVAHTAGWSEDELVEKCQGLIAMHQSDGDRYNTVDKREGELRRMWRYMKDNPCYDFSIGALKNMMNHAAPDLDGIPATREDVKEGIAEADAEEAAEGEADVDEYDDVARGITLNKYGVYKSTAEGKVRICALSFGTPSVLMSVETCQIVGYETDVLVNGRPAGRVTLELDVFSGLMQFNRFAAKYGHSFQGTDAQVRIVMMRFVEAAKDKGSTQYIVKREGLDLVSIPHHENPLYHTPFAVWADGHNVTLQPDIADSGLALAFAGFPDPRGVYRTDVSMAPAMKPWLAEEANAARLQACLRNLATCQKAELIGKYLGWYTACFWKQFFQKAYGKFPLLHVNGAAGAGKTDMTVSIASLFSYQQEPKVTSPGSSLFSIGQYLTASASLPLIMDEYKPHELPMDTRNKLRAMFRDAYNQRDVARGGGTRESDDYRVLHTQQLSAPLVFIAEASEDEAAVMERVVLVTVVRPAASINLQYLHRFQAFRKDKHLLGILGQYLAGHVVSKYTLEQFREEFDTLYQKAQQRYMINEDDLKNGLDDEALRNKQNAKERTVFNHTVALFGMQKFRALVKAALNDRELDIHFASMEEGIYARMSDLQASTTPEVIRVLSEISTMSYSVEGEQPTSIRRGKEYALVAEGGKTLLEIDARTAYFRYRIHMKAANTAPLFSSQEQFVYALTDSPTFVRKSTGLVLERPGALILDMEALQRLGVSPFK